MHSFFSYLYIWTELTCGCVISRPSGPNKALKLGAKGKELDNFVDKLKSEGENIIIPNAGKKTSEVSKVLQPPANTERYTSYSSSYSNGLLSVWYIESLQRVMCGSCVLFLWLSVHLKIEEKISLTCGRDGGLQNMELLGMIILRISEDKNGRIRLYINNNDKKGMQLQVILHSGLPKLHM